MNNLPSISVVIINWNGRVFLERCLQSLHEQSFRNFEVILADNASEDDSVAYVRQHFPNVIVHPFEENLGYSEGNNRAVLLARAPFVFFLNNDTHLHPACLETLWSVTQHDSTALILAPLIMTYDGALSSGAGTSVDILGFPAGPHHKVFFADGAALFIRRDFFDRLGGFDSWHFMFFEETDLCWRAALRGHFVHPVPMAIVYHKAGGTAGSSLAVGRVHSTTRWKRRLSHRNHIAMLLKNYSGFALLIVLPVLAILTFAELCLLTASGQSRVLVDSYVPAWVDIFRSRQHLLEMRRQAQSKRLVSDITIIRHLRWRLAAYDRIVRLGIPVVH